MERESAAPSALTHPDGAVEPVYQTRAPIGAVEPVGIVVVVVVVVVVLVVVLVVLVVAGTEVVVTVAPASYDPLDGGPAEALVASHDDAEQAATQTNGEVYCETIPNTPFDADSAEAV